MYRSYMKKTLNCYWKIQKSLYQSREGQGLPWWLSSGGSACHCRRHGFDS